MIGFLVRRILGAALVVGGVVILVFMLIHFTPGDPVQVMLGESATPADQAALRHALGLDRPLPVQLVAYFDNLAHLRLGTSLYSQQPIATILARRIPATAELAGAAALVAVLLAFPLGVIAAVHKDTGWDYGSMGFALLGVSIPNFWMGPLLILCFSVWLGWFPVSGREGFASLVLPAVTLGTAMAAILSRMVRSSLLEVLGEDYVRTARAKGLSERRVILHHGLRNALLPVITMLGLQLGTLLGGAVITELVFSWPGVGQLLIDAIHRRDYPVVQACVLLISVTYVVVNMLTDFVYAWVDPRVRAAGRGA
ncbi:glutathione transport system permease protein GsiC [bacterium BMS3Bbin12]|nr:glutathione transport system permease protein GsiC [bacterium BMS3Abin12]GBE47996.1 glutathione transport system permease protein GsiC [bacterium BMS3Bbin12]GBE50147.1 glutathione transport system permease protein GsiC [bacterium BMS3Bbin13]